ncbi:MAG: outer membrane beta-barrel protein [Bacteroidales bacterium]|nr:outer membrane beta-barrel protein [Bacteroidales bacterium]MBO7141854.1 outer membrane beta-barrel protein [Bacteroidales bacterium]
MKKLTIVLILLISTYAISTAQVRWEFNYFALEIGMNHTFAGAPDSLQNFVVSTDNGKVPVYPVKNVEYAPGFNLGLQFHHDFNNDKSGIVFGVTYSSYAAASRYSSADKSLELKQINRVTCVGFPVYLKFGHQIYNNQGYFYFGAQFNLNLGMTTSEKLKNNSTKVKHKQDKETYNAFSTPIFAGFNYKLFNMRFSVMPQHFLNKDYQISVGNIDNTQTVTPYGAQPKVLFYISTGFLIPLSQWTTNRSYLLSKIF